MLIHLIKISFKHFLWGRLKFWKTRNLIRHVLDQEELALVGRGIKKNCDQLRINNVRQSRRSAGICGRHREGLVYAQRWLSVILYHQLMQQHCNWCHFSHYHTDEGGKHWQRIVISTQSIMHSSIGGPCAHITAPHQEENWMTFSFHFYFVQQKGSWLT